MSAPSGLRLWCVKLIYRSTFSCKTAIRLQSQALDRPLTWGERMKLRFHLQICACCRHYGQQVRLIHETMPDMIEHMDEAKDLKLPDNYRKRIKSALR